MDNVIKALMLCRDTEEFGPIELANPHYFTMPNGQLVLFASDCHILLIVKDTAGMIDRFEFEPTQTPNIACAIPTEPCNATLDVQRLCTALRASSLGRDPMADEHTAVIIKGRPFGATQMRRLCQILALLDLNDTVPMVVSKGVTGSIKIETESYLIVQSGMIEQPGVINKRLNY